MKLEKTVVKEAQPVSQRPWEDRNAGMLREDSKRNRRQAEELQALNQTLDNFSAPPQ